jgi:hypothetical protein
LRRDASLANATEELGAGDSVPSRLLSYPCDDSKKAAHT